MTDTDQQTQTHTDRQADQTYRATDTDIETQREEDIVADRPSVVDGLSVNLLRWGRTEPTTTFFL